MHSMDYTVDAHVLMGFLRGQDEEIRLGIVVELLTENGFNRENAEEFSEAVRTYSAYGLDWISRSEFNSLAQVFLDRYLLEVVDWLGADLSHEAPQATSFSAMDHMHPVSQEDIERWLREEGLRRQEEFFSTLVA